jgi:hypothetical protein
MASEANGHPTFAAKGEPAWNFSLNSANKCRFSFSWVLKFWLSNGYSDEKYSLDAEIQCRYNLDVSFLLLPVLVSVALFWVEDATKTCIL